MGFDVSNKEEFDIVTRKVGGRPFISLTSPGLPRCDRDQVCRNLNCVAARPGRVTIPSRGSAGKSWRAFEARPGRSPE
jgi:hypothetical protein